MTLKLKLTRVHTASHVRCGVAFGDLADQGLLRKRYVLDGPRSDPDAFHIEWDVIGDVEFTTQRGETYKQGDTIIWG